MGDRMSEVKLPILRTPLETLENIMNDGVRAGLDDVPMPFKVLSAFERLVEQPARGAEQAAAEFERRIFTAVKGETIFPEQTKHAAYRVQEHILHIIKTFPARWRAFTNRWVSNGSSLETFEIAARDRWFAARDRWSATYDRMSALVDSHQVDGCGHWMMAGDERRAYSYNWHEAAYAFLASGLREMGYDVHYKPFSASAPLQLTPFLQMFVIKGTCC